MGCAASKSEGLTGGSGGNGEGGGNIVGGGHTPTTEMNVSEQNLTALDGLVPHLIKINAADNKLAQISTEIGVCTELMVLDVSGNELTALPAEIGSCKALE